MDKKILDLIINIPLSLFLEANLEDDTFNELKGHILYAESNISEELSANLFGKNFIEKEDIIREYIVSIGHMYDQILNCTFDDDADEYAIVNPIALGLVRDCYQTIIDTVSIICVSNSINLQKIIDSNILTAGILDISVYDNYVKSSLLEKGKLNTKLKASFSDENSFELFEYLINHFDKKYSHHNIASCIYRLMTKEKLIDCDLKPEKFRSIVQRDPYNFKINYFLKSESELSQSIKKHYKKIKEQYFTKQ